MGADRKECPLCDSGTTERFVLRPAVAVHQNLLMSDEAAAKGISRGRLSMRFCGACGFVFNDAFDASLLGYGAEYDNTQVLSPAFAEHVDHLVDHLVRDRGVRGARIVEVGCGKGAFLSKIVERKDAENIGIGFDPAYVGPSESLDGRLRFVPSFYDERAADVPADVVVCRHVIEHVADPVALLRSVRRALAGSPQARVFFETPCVRWILENQVVWDFFYEHCSLFTADSLTSAFEKAGLVVRDVRHVFSGQYLFLEATPSAQPLAHRSRLGALDVPALATRFAEHEAECSATWRDRLERLSAARRVVVWGAGAKGVTFANLIDPDRRLIDCVVDINPAKQGKYLPGTGHPIVAPASLVGREVVLLVLNPNYLREIEQTVARLRLDAEIIDLMNR